jgi:hypothetical protein
MDLRLIDGPATGRTLQQPDQSFVARASLHDARYLARHTIDCVGEC